MACNACGGIVGPVRVARSDTPISVRQPQIIAQVQQPVLIRQIAPAVIPTVRTARSGPAVIPFSDVDRHRV
jgi:hypothetical protein